MTFTPYPSQLDDLENLRENNWTGLLAIEPGGGKTALSCMVIRESGAGVTLIVAPSQTINAPDRNWPKEVRNIVGEEVKVISNKNIKEQSHRTELELGIPGVYAVTPAFISRKGNDISLWAGDLLIYDEVHEGATAGCKTQKAMSGYDLTEDNPLCDRFTHRLALSGTPMRQNFQNFWATMRFLWGHLSGRDDVAYINHYVWCKDRMTSETVYTGQKDRFGNVKTATNFLVEKIPGQLISQMPCVVQHKRRERCCDHHPNGFLSFEAPLEIERFVELTVNQKKAIRELEKHYMTYIEGNPLVTELTITQQQRIRQLCLGEANVTYYAGEDSEGNPVEKSRLEFDEDCASPFTDELLKILGEIGADEPVVVFLDSQRFAHVLVKKLRLAGITADEYSGKHKADLKRFGADYRVLVGVTESIGSGTDGLQAKAINEIWLEVPVKLTKETQANARLDRMGARAQIQRWYLRDDLGYSSGRMDSNIEKRLRLNKSMRRTEKEVPSGVK